MKLKFPKEQERLYTYFEYSMDKELGGFSAKGSFCRTFMQVMDETAAAVGISREYKPTLTDYCEHMDDVYNERKAMINHRMVEFLKENNGVIDRWPEPESHTYVVFDGDAGENKFYFNYAGSAYKVIDGGVRRISEEPQPAPHGACPYEPDPAVENIARARALRAAELRKLDEEKANNSWRGLRAAIALLPAALG